MTAAEIDKAYNRALEILVGTVTDSTPTDEMAHWALVVLALKPRVTVDVLR